MIQLDNTDSRSAARYFKNYKLDYPNNDINKASKKYVKAMKKLHVCAPRCYCLLRLTCVGNNTGPHRFQQTVP